MILSHISTFFVFVFFFLFSIWLYLRRCVWVKRNISSSLLLRGPSTNVMKIHNIFPRPSNRISCYHFANLRASFGAFHTSSTTTKNRQLLRHRATVLSLATFRFSSSRSLYGKHLPVVAVPFATDSIKSSDLVVLRPNQSVLKRNISIATTLLIFVPVNSEFQCLFRNNLHQTSTKMVWPTEHDRKEGQEVPTYIEKYIHCVVFVPKEFRIIDFSV